MFCEFSAAVTLGVYFDPMLEKLREHLSRHNKSSTMLIRYNPFTVELEIFDDGKLIVLAELRTSLGSPAKISITVLGSIRDSIELVEPIDHDHYLFHAMSLLHTTIFENLP